MASASTVAVAEYSGGGSSDLGRCGKCRYRWRGGVVSNLVVLAASAGPQAARSLGHMAAWATRAQGRVGTSTGRGRLGTGSYAGRDARCAGETGLRVVPTREGVPQLSAGGLKGGS